MKKKKNIVVAIIVMFMLSTAIILVTVKTKSKKDGIHFKSESLTLYGIDHSSHELLLRKILEINNEEVVNEICDICNKAEFIKYDYTLNMGLRYYLVFDDNGLVIAFADFDNDYGTVGENFHTEYLDKIFGNNLDIYDNLKPRVHIPMEVIDIIKDSLENRN